MDIDKIKKDIEYLNEQLENNRQEFERLRPLSEQINNELQDNKTRKKEIETKLDQYYFQIQQSNLS